MLAYLNDCGKGLRIREVLKILVKCVSPFFGSCFSVCAVSLSGPGAFPSPILLITFLISIGRISGIEWFVGSFRYLLTCLLVLVWNSSYVVSSVRDLNCLSSASASASALSFGSYTSPFLPCKG